MMSYEKPFLLRIATIPMSLELLLEGQMSFMKRKGFHVEVASADGNGVEVLVRKEGVKHHVLPLKRSIAPLNDLKSLWATYLLIQKLKPDIVHTHTPKAGLIGMLAATLAGTSVRIHTVAGLPLMTSTGLKRQILILVEMLTYICAHHVWPNSVSLETFILENKLTRRSKLKVIGNGSSNGIDTNSFSSASIDLGILGEIKSSLGYECDNYYFVYVGRILKDKGIEELVEAFMSLKSRWPNIKLLLVGPYESDINPISDHTRSVIDSEDSILSTGYSTRVKYYLELANSCIFPSHREGFPNVPLQAGAMECPLICSQIGGNIDIVTDGKTGLLHKVQDALDLAEKMEFALENPKEMMKLARQLREKIHADFQRSVIQEHIKDEYLALYYKNSHTA